MNTDLSRISRFLLLTTLLAVGACHARADIALTGGSGRLVAIATEGERFEIESNMTVHLPGWSESASIAWDTTTVDYSEQDSVKQWDGRMLVDEAKYANYIVRIEEFENRIAVEMSLTARAELDIEGILVSLEVPVEVFRGGMAEFTDGDQLVAESQFPQTLPADFRFLNGRANAAHMRTEDGQTAATVTYDRSRSLTIQDQRNWGGNTYNLYTNIAGKQLSPNETVSIQFDIEIDVPIDHSPVTLTLDADTVRYRLDGFGGNYCFQLESPVTDYTLEHLRSAWARTEVSLHVWEPVNDNADPASTDWEYFRSRDSEGSDMRREFLMARELSERGIPFVASIWWLPPWMYSNPEPDPYGNGKILDPEMWDEFLESLGAYMVHMRDVYGVEPDLFSFNESDIGVKVRFTAEEHREVVKRIGAHLDSLGLKTRMLLGDTANPRRSLSFVSPAVADPEAMSFVGALATHSWGGAPPETWNAWADLAEQLGIPFLITEAGTDAGAYHSPEVFETFEYALREMEMYQTILLHARPQGLMQWEFTGDYPLAIGRYRPSLGDNLLVPTKRFWFISHFCNLTPLRSDVLTTYSDREPILFTAFRGEEDGQPALTLHVGNTASSRPAVLTGIPEGISALRIIQTTDERSIHELEPVEVEGGAVTLELPQWSLTTLTNSQVELAARTLWRIE